MLHLYLAYLDAVRVAIGPSPGQKVELLRASPNSVNGC